MGEAADHQDIVSCNALFQGISYQSDSCIRFLNQRFLTVLSAADAFVNIIGNLLKSVCLLPGRKHSKVSWSEAVTIGPSKAE